MHLLSGQEGGFLGVLPEERFVEDAEQAEDQGVSLYTNASPPQGGYNVDERVLLGGLLVRERHYVLHNLFGDALTPRALSDERGQIDVLSSFSSLVVPPPCHSLVRHLVARLSLSGRQGGHAKTRDGDMVGLYRGGDVSGIRLDLCLVLSSGFGALRAHDLLPHQHLQQAVGAPASLCEVVRRPMGILVDLLDHSRQRAFLDCGLNLAVHRLAEAGLGGEVEQESAELGINPLHRVVDPPLADEQHLWRDRNRRWQREAIPDAPWDLMQGIPERTPCSCGGFLSVGWGLKNGGAGSESRRECRYVNGWRHFDAVGLPPSF
eukprot:PhM_4_TR2434/c0_g3_i13/m.78688